MIKYAHSSLDTSFKAIELLSQEVERLNRPSILFIAMGSRRHISDSKSSTPLRKLLPGNLLKFLVCLNEGYFTSLTDLLYAILVAISIRTANDQLLVETLFVQHN